MVDIEIRDRLMFICPNPGLWQDIYAKLKRRWVSHRLQGPPPPGPLVLGYWYGSNDFQKKERWDAFVEWAREHDWADTIPTYTDDYSYLGPTSCPYPCPDYEWQYSGDQPSCNYDYTEKEKPGPDQVEAALAELRERWPEIAGDALAPITQPVIFSGAKKRKLLIQASRRHTPPWGAWDRIQHTRDCRTAFREFRQRVNDAITPLAVDHIDFEVCDY